MSASLRRRSPTKRGDAASGFQGGIVRARLEREVTARLEAAFAQAAADPDPDPAGLVPLPERLP